MDLTNFTDDQLEILKTVFNSFDQGDPDCDLGSIPTEQLKDNVYETYEKMRHDIEHWTIMA